MTISTPQSAAELMSPWAMLTPRKTPVRIFRVSGISITEEMLRHAFSNIDRFRIMALPPPCWRGGGGGGSEMETGQWEVRKQ